MLGLLVLCSLLRAGDVHSINGERRVYTYCCDAQRFISHGSDDNSGRVHQCSVMSTEREYRCRRCDVHLATYVGVWYRCSTCGRESCRVFDWPNSGGLCGMCRYRR